MKTSIDHAIMYIAVEFQKTRFNNGSLFREWASRQMKLPEVFFHHHSGGKTICHPTAFRWGTSSTGQGRLYAIGNAACQLMMTHWQDFLVMDAHPVLKPGICSLKASDRITAYSVDQLIFDRRSMRGMFHRIEKNELSDADINGYAESLLKYSILAQLKMLGEEIPEDWLIGDVHVEKSKSIGIKIHERSVFAAPVHFRTNVVLLGPWHAGAFISRGFGYVRPISKNHLQCT